MFSKLLLFTHAAQKFLSKLFCHLLFLEFHLGNMKVLYIWAGKWVILSLYWNISWGLPKWKFLLTFVLFNSLRKIIWLGVLLIWGKFCFFYTRRETGAQFLLKCRYVHIWSEQQTRWLKLLLVWRSFDWQPLFVDQRKKKPIWIWTDSCLSFWINCSGNSYSSQFLMTWSTLLQIQHIAGWWGRHFHHSLSSYQTFYKEYSITEEIYFDLYSSFSICQQFVLDLEFRWVPHLT